MPFDRITIDPGKMNGQPCVRGLRLTVRRVLDLIATYPDRAEFFREFPELSDEDLSQVLAYASAQLPDRVAELAELKCRSCATTGFHAMHNLAKTAMLLPSFLRTARTSTASNVRGLESPLRARLIAGRDGAMDFFHCRD
jgi:uncharacterized protein (DUF433 family)